MLCVRFNTLRLTLHHCTHAYLQHPPYALVGNKSTGLSELELISWKSVLFSLIESEILEQASRQVATEEPKKGL